MKKYLIRSLTWHFLLLFTLILFQWIKNRTDFSKKRVHFINKAIKVDVVELPKLTLKELKWKNLEQQKSVRRNNKSDFVDTRKDVVEYKVEKKSRSKLNNLLKQFSRKEIPKEKDKKENKYSDQLEKLIYAGNKLSRGKNVEGETQDQESSIIQEYGEELVKIIKPYWKLPKKYLNSDLNCHVKVFLSPTGKVNKLFIFKSSGEEEYDQYVLQTIQNASPFPAPDIKIVKNLEQGELVLGFPL